jgi:uncharacterized protein YceH (UPF0502 family)
MRLPRTLAPTEIRILGSLLEKQQTTPEYYPLTLGALVAACNQKSNREPVLELSEQEILAALEAMRELVLVWKVTGSRAEKWEENLVAKLGLEPAPKAILTLLFLRGPQTPGELKGRSERMHPFASLGEVDAALAAMAEGKDPLVAELPRRPGQKETRWAHLLSGDLPAAAPAPPSPVSWSSPTQLPQGESLGDRVALLEEKLEALSAEFARLRSRLGDP